MPVEVPSHGGFDFRRCRRRQGGIRRCATLTGVRQGGVEETKEARVQLCAGGGAGSVTALLRLGSVRASWATVVWA
jgi:hypothetical protein